MFKPYAHLLDKKTRRFVKKTSKKKLGKILSGVTIYVLDGDGMKKVKDAMDAAGVDSYTANPAGMGFGKTIYIRDGPFARDTTGDLIGHEAVHTLQTKAHGGLEGMFEAYGSNMDDLEIAAYEFGGWTDRYSRKTQRRTHPGGRVFQEHPIRIR